MLFKEITAEEFADIRAKEAYEDGEQAGFAKGRSEGEAAGLQKGRSEGEAMKQREIARNLKHLGIGLSEIVKSTGLSVEEVEEL